MITSLLYFLLSQNNAQTFQHFLSHNRSNVKFHLNYIICPHHFWVFVKFSWMEIYFYHSTHSRTHARTHARAHTRTRTHTHTHTCTQTCTQTCTHVQHKHTQIVTNTIITHSYLLHDNSNDIFDVIISLVYIDRQTRTAQIHK